MEEHGTNAENNRIIIDREDIVIPYSDVLEAYNRTKQMGAGQIPVVNKLEDFGDWTGAKYLYSIFYRFGLLDVSNV